ncbi:aminopeptidase YpdF [Peptococcaceae bacterium CEB3]|nr:aminopeptidase YpdF [Peptococcaceae bacterium CEB3]
MAENDLQAVILRSPENRYYFSNFRGTAGYLLITPEETFLYTDFRYLDQAKTQAPLYKIIHHRVNALEHICSDLAGLRVSRLGLEMDVTPAADYLEITGSMPSVEMLDISGDIFALRMIKDAEEIRKISRGIEICDHAFSHILNFIHAGISEREIGLELEIFMRKEGAEGIKTNHVIASGERSALPHGQATDRRVKKGDFVTMDYGARVDGYYSDFTRTVIIGEPSPQRIEIYRVVQQAQMEALVAIGPGKVCSEMDEVGRSVIRKAGYGEFFGHSLGHSLGLSIHEKPGMRAGDPNRLQPGMVMSVEPGIYLPGFGGVRIEDVIVVTEKGCVNFTHSTKELQVLT